MKIYGYHSGTELHLHTKFQLKHFSFLSYHMMKNNVISKSVMWPITAIRSFDQTRFSVIAEEFQTQKSH